MNWPRTKVHILPTSIDHFVRAGSFPQIHKDPFDRILAAQANLEGIALLSADPVFDRFPVRRIW